MMKIHKPALANRKITPAKMNTQQSIRFEHMYWPVIVVSLICFPLLYTATIYIYTYMMDMKWPVLSDILLGPLGKLMTGIIVSSTSFLPVMPLYCIFALRYKILWLCIPLVGFLTPIGIELIFMYVWDTQNSSMSLWQHIYHERMEIISLHITSVVSSCILYLSYKLACRKYTRSAPQIKTTL